MWTALLAGGLSALSGFGAQRSAKKQAKTQAANDYIANVRNEAAIAATNQTNKNLAKTLGRQLARTKEVTAEHTVGGTTSTSASGQDNYSYVDTAAMMKAAEASGFNPVTFLNAGGLQAYTQTGSTGWSAQQDITDLLVTTTRTGHNAAAVASLKAGLMSPQTFQMAASQAQNIPSTMQVVGDAGTAALNAYRQDAARQGSQDFQREMLNTQLAAIAKNQAANRSFYVPSMVTAGGTQSNATGGALSANPAAKSPFEMKQAAQTNPFEHYFGFKSDPSLPDAGSIEDTYGELGGSLYGLTLKPLGDVSYNIFGTSTADSVNYWKKVGRNAINALGLSGSYKPDQTPSVPLTLRIRPQAR